MRRLGEPRVLLLPSSINRNDDMFEAGQPVERLDHIGKCFAADIPKMTGQQQSKAGFIYTFTFDRLRWVEPVKRADQTVLEKVAHCQSRNDRARLPNDLGIYQV
jgi:hypothetical protein